MHISHNLGQLSLLFCTIHIWKSDDNQMQRKQPNYAEVLAGNQFRINFKTST